jgi:hypothetical protein
VGGYDGDVSYELQDVPWLYPGDRAVYFLAHAPGARLNTTNSSLLPADSR